MADDVIGNGNKTWALLLRKMDETHAEVKESRRDMQHVDRRLVAVESKINGLPCETHSDSLGILDERVDEVEKCQAIGRGRMMVAGQWAVAATAIGAILWKVIGN